MKTLVKKCLKKIARPAFRQLKPAPDLPREPISTKWGSERGTPIARHYVDRFIESCRGDITGAVLEVKDRRYTRALGWDVATSDVLDIDPSNAGADLIADLSAADDLPSERYDCFILTETLHYIYDLKEAVHHAHRFLKPGGVLLATVPGTAPIDRELKDSEYWRFTENSCRRLFGDQFGPEQIEVTAYGNFSSCLAGLTGLAVEEFEPGLLERTSDLFVQGVGVRARKRSIS